MITPHQATNAFKADAIGPTFEAAIGSIMLKFELASGNVGKLPTSMVPIDPQGKPVGRPPGRTRQAILQAIVDHGPIGRSQISNLSGRRPRDIDNSLARLREGGHIESIPGSSPHIYCITESGRARVSQGEVGTESMRLLLELVSEAKTLTSTEAAATLKLNHATAKNSLLALTRQGRLKRDRPSKDKPFVYELAQ